MRKLFLIACLEMFMFGCSPILKSNSNDNNMSLGQIHELQVHNFSEIPKDLLENIDKMGVDNSSILNEYEGRYLNFIFNIDPQDFNLVGKKVGFWGNKIDYFNDTRSTDRNFKTVGGSSLYILMLLKKWKMTDMMLLLLIGINFHFQQKKSLKD
ncbi:hypothetical protein PGF_00017950 [Porphyromonas gingivalis 381]|uniref:DUF8192 domain-containing protein n=1 Tax=Porphyromonas gingivalis (strain ATCC 33277 / DSM 20709 / CIP 103683 / JCM 12257 / NCTC 11834 / 2561) TaxID=431947 RepID=B2RLU4_PORG3|nr:hypothetical protein PGF_00017950 [Porphyromonas gingivalis 381]BAG34339.1 conserved hypothetical protein [Porphyromonas gingivalis ATCC 33277]SJL20505.1 hypothetical protein PGIN_3-3_01623 [Porphyromonas gingivalis]